MGLREKLLELIHETGALTNQQISKFYTNCGKFENAFVINGCDQPERMQQAAKTLTTVNISFERFVKIEVNGVHGHDNDSREFIHQIKKCFNNLKDGELGCLLSRLCLLALAASHTNSSLYTMIFEDDIITSLTAGIDPLLRELLQVDCADFIYLGKCLETCHKMEHIRDNIYKAHSPSCAHAYAIRNSVACRILEVLEDFCGCFKEGSHGHGCKCHE